MDWLFCLTAANALRAQALWLRAWGLDDDARETTRLADLWQALSERTHGLRDDD
jgi:hypothetical protein